MLTRLLEALAGMYECVVLDLPGEPTPVGIVLVSHHVEEIPPDFGHGLILREGSVVASGPLDDVLTDEVLSTAYGLPIHVEHRDGRASARLRS